MNLATGKEKWRHSPSVPEQITIVILGGPLATIVVIILVDMVNANLTICVQGGHYLLVAECVVVYFEAQLRRELEELVEFVVDCIWHWQEDSWTQKSPGPGPL